MSTPNNLPQVFKFQEYEVRTLVSDQLWLNASDCCKALDIVNTSQAVAELDEDEKTTLSITESGSNYKHPALYINEPGFYGLVWNSRKPNAVAFRRWLKHEVLPSIRKTGNYSMDGRSPEEQLADELTMLQLVQSAVDHISKAICQPWIVEDPERVFYGKSAMDHMRLEVGRSNKSYTEVAKYFHGRNVFDGFDARGRITKAQMDIRNGRILETQMKLPFDSK